MTLRTVGIAALLASMVAVYLAAISGWRPIYLGALADFLVGSLLALVAIEVMALRQDIRRTVDTESED